MGISTLRDIKNLDDEQWLAGKLLALIATNQGSILAKSCASLAQAIRFKLRVEFEGADCFALGALIAVAKKYGIIVQSSTRNSKFDKYEIWNGLFRESNAESRRVLVPSVNERGRDYPIYVPIVVNGYWAYLRRRSHSFPMVDFDSLFVLLILGYAYDNRLSQFREKALRAVKEAEKCGILDCGSLSWDKRTQFGFIHEVANSSSDAILHYLGLGWTRYGTTKIVNRSDVVNHPFNTSAVPLAGKYDRQLLWQNPETQKRERSQGRVWMFSERRFPLKEMSRTLQIINELGCHKFLLPKGDISSFQKEFQAKVETYQLRHGDRRKYLTEEPKTDRKWMHEFIGNERRAKCDVFVDWEKACAALGLNAEELLIQFFNDKWSDENHVEKKRPIHLAGNKIEYNNDYTWIRLPSQDVIRLTPGQGVIIRTLHKLQGCSSTPTPMKKVILEAFPSIGDSSNSFAKRFRGARGELEALCEKLPGNLIRLRHSWPPIDHQK